MNSIKELAEKMRDCSAESTAILPHVNADADAIGSVVALYHGLKKMGKNPVVLMVEKPAKNHLFLLEGVELSSEIARTFETVITVDTASAKQVWDRAELLAQAGEVIAIDHHSAHQEFTEQRYVDSGAAASGEIIYDLLNELGVEIDGCTAAALYAAISSDTGSFMHSSTTARTFHIAEALMKIGFDFQRVNTELYRSRTMTYAVNLQRALRSMRLHVDGLIAVTHVFDETLCSSEEYSGIVEFVLGISGVEVSVFARNVAGGGVKFSMRSKSHFDVAKVAVAMGGGGHVKAAGFTTDLPYEKAQKKVVAMLYEQVD